MEENKGEIREKIIDLFLFRNKRKQMRVKYENNLWKTQSIMKTNNKKYLDNSF